MINSWIYSLVLYDYNYDCMAYVITANNFIANEFRALQLYSFTAYG